MPSPLHTDDADMSSRRMHRMFVDDHTSEYSAVRRKLSSSISTATSHLAATTIDPLTPNPAAAARFTPPDTTASSRRPQSTPTYSDAHIAPNAVPSLIDGGLRVSCAPMRLDASQPTAALTVGVA
jgi:hypothetical protein